MSAYIEMPKLSDTMTEGTLVKWRKAVGDKVEIGDIIADVETDKAVMEMEAFEEGKISEILVPEGGKVRVGERLARLGGDGVPSSGAKAPASAPASSDEVIRGDHSVENPASATEKAKRDTGILSNSKPQTKQSAASVSAGEQNRVKASPLAKKIARSKGVDISSLEGSGPGGRVIARDVESAQSKAAPAVGKPAPSPAAPIAIPATGAADKRIPLSGMRRVIAERLLASKTQIPHFYLNIEVDAGELVRLRGQINAAGEKAGLPKLTVNDFVLKAVTMAAVKVPRVNASFAGDAVIEYGNVHLAVAVAVEDGLMTPVVRQAQGKSLREISESVKDLATRARSKKLKPEEYQDGTITVSNLGGQGIESFAAIINPPQSIIVSVGAIVKKPVVNDADQIVVGQRMAVGLSADHRVVDGAVGAQFLAELRQLLENPLLIVV